MTVLAHVHEAYLDLSAFCQDATADDSLRRALPIAREVKDAIRAERQLTASIGLASNKLLAKLASDQHKPDGLTLILESAKVQMLRPLPVSVLHGVGKVTAGQLRQAGIETVDDPGSLYRLGCHLLARHELVRRPLRLLGLGVSHLTEPGRQLLLPLGR